MSYLIKNTIVTILLSGFAFQSIAQKSTIVNQGKKIDFINDFGLIIFPLKLNNSDTLYFLFDTGFDVNVLDESVAEDLELTLSDKISIPQPGGTIEYSIVNDLSIEIDNNSLQKENFIITPIRHLSQLIGHELDGILGIDFMKKYKIEINYANHFLIIHQQEELIDTKGYLSLPTEVTNNEPFIYCKIKNADGKTVISKFKMDTGSLDALGLNKNFIEDNLILKDDSRTISTKGVGIGGETEGILFEVNDFLIGQSCFDKLIIGATLDSKGFENRDDAGTIGAEILSNFNWILDMKNSQILCAENSHFSTTQKIDKSGLWVVENRDNEKIIYQVLENSPSYVAGLKSGQIIETIDGIKANQFTLSQIKALFSGNEGTPVSIKIKDHSKPIVINLKTPIN
ncbi:MAG: aspartyl protease family protein [Flavobacteriales bacterium]|nr:aspartyl protease family protein [Flavobacteriales bacterium]